MVAIKRLRFIRWFTRSRYVLIRFEDNQANVVVRCSIEELIKAQKVLEDVCSTEVKKLQPDALTQVANLERTLRLIKREK